MAWAMQLGVLWPAHCGAHMPNGTKLYYGWVSQNERLLSKITFSKNGCWEWTGTISNKGYPAFMIFKPKRKNCYAHRLIWELTKGEKIPDGLEMDHLCKNTKCVRPSHMEPVTGKENNLRSNSPTSQNAKKLFCLRGHPFSKENTYIRPDNHGRQCIKCVSFRAKRSSIRRMRGIATTSDKEAPCPKLP